MPLEPIGTVGLAEKHVEDLLESIKLWFLMRLKGPWTERWPGRPGDIDEERMIAVLDELHDNDSSVTEISTCIKNKLQLEEDETFCCLLCIAKKPTYLSEVEGPTQMPPMPMMAPDAAADDFPFATLSGSAWRAIRYYQILEPDVMNAVKQRRDKDRIDYKSKQG